MHEPTSPETDLICRSILEYLHHHPQAADSLEGIASWWLSSSGFSSASEAVQVALDRLVARRQIARVHLPDGRTLYQSRDKVSGSHPAWTPPRPRSRS